MDKSRERIDRLRQREREGGDKEGEEREQDGFFSH